MDTELVDLPPDAGKAFDIIARYEHPEPLLVVISGPSGVGKDSVIARMRERGHRFCFVVTMTDRPPRPGERDGVDYHFVSTEQFEALIANDGFFEHAQVYGQYKGVPKDAARRALASGIDVVLRLDVQGAATVRAKIPEALTVFLSPPSLQVLVSRLRRRSGDSQRQLQRRIETALGEMRCAEAFDFLVINREGCLDETIDKVVAIIQAEKCRTRRRQVAP
jgi:guanylate kinase